MAQFFTCNILTFIVMLHGDGCYAMAGSIPHAIACGMHYVACIGIPYGRMTMSHDHLVCLFDHLVCLFEKSILDGWNSYAT